MRDERGELGETPDLFVEVVEIAGPGLFDHGVDLLSVTGSEVFEAGHELAAELCEQRLCARGIRERVEEFLLEVTPVCDTGNAASEPVCAAIWCAE